MDALWYSFKLRTVIVMQVKNYFFWSVLENVAAALLEWLLNILVTGSTDVKLLLFTLYFSSLQLMLVALLCLVTEHLCDCHFSVLLWCLLICSSCFRSPKLVCSNWKLLSRCVAHFQINLLTTAFFCLPHYLSFVFWMQKTWDVTPLTTGWWTDVSWILNHLYVWLVSFPV